jgi:hypothetical protein
MISNYINPFPNVDSPSKHRTHLLRTQFLFSTNGELTRTNIGLTRLSGEGFMTHENFFMKISGTHHAAPDAKRRGAYFAQRRL